MRDLVQKLPAGNQQDVGTSDDTIAAVLATLNEVIKKHPEFSRYLFTVLPLLEACFDLISGSSLSMKIQIMGYRVDVRTHLNKRSLPRPKTTTA